MSLKGKRVVFVGAWPGLRGIGLGQFIDDFDIIVKTNGSVFFNNYEYNHDYGSRIDYLYTNNQFYRNMAPFDIAMFKTRGITHIRMKTCHGRDLKYYGQFFDVKVIKDSILEVNKVLKSAAMGAYIYTDILKQNPKEFMLLGVDFFASKKAVFQHDNYQEYIDGYLPDKIRIEGNKINVGKTSDGHNFLDNAKYIYDLYCRYDNFLMLDSTRELLEGIVNGEIEQG